MSTTATPANATMAAATRPAPATAPHAADVAIDAGVATNPPAQATAPVAVEPAAELPAATVPVVPTQPAKAGGVTFPVRPATTATAEVAPPAVGHASAADAGSIGGALFSLLLVVGLILGLGWLAKRMPGMQRGAATSHLKVVASIALGARERAVVVDVGGTQLLLGVGQGGVRALHTLEQPLPVAEAGAPSPFAQVLAQHFGRKP